MAAAKDIQSIKFEGKTVHYDANALGRITVQEGLMMAGQDNAMYMQALRTIFGGSLAEVIDATDDDASKLMQVLRMIGEVSGTKN